VINCTVRLRDTPAIKASASHLQEKMMRTFGLGAVALLLAMLTAGCAVHTWTSGPDATLSFSEASGRCKLMAMGAERGFVAFGSASYAAGAALGGAIGNAVREQGAYNAYMEANGFVTVQ
jgi:hypothetical protein